jgi:hypothetical protein
MNGEAPMLLRRQIVGTPTFRSEVQYTALYTVPTSDRGISERGTPNSDGRIEIGSESTLISCDDLLGKVSHE